MNRYRFVILNNAGHSWLAQSAEDIANPTEQPPTVLPQLLEDGWTPVRETPMGGGASPLAHSLILLEKSADRVTRRGRRS